MRKHSAFVQSCQQPAKRCARVVSILAAFGAIYSVSLPEARAQGLGRSGDLVIGVERVFGLYSIREERDDPGGYTDTATSIGFLMQRHTHLLTTPRVGIDYFVARSFNIGGSLALYSYDNGFDDSGILFAPRVGYVVPFNTSWGFWPRGGLTFTSEDGPDRSHVALSFDATFYFMPNPHVGFTGAPVLELGFLGEDDVGNGEDRDYNARVLGATLGMFARF